MPRTTKKKPQPQNTFTPLYDRVIVRRDEAPETFGEGKSAIFIPESAREKMQRGTIVAAGAGKVSDLTNEIRAMTVKPGDKIIFGKYTGDEIEIDGEKLLMMREDQVYGIINTNEKK